MSLIDWSKIGPAAQPSQEIADVGRMLDLFQQRKTAIEQANAERSRLQSAQDEQVRHNTQLEAASAAQLAAEKEHYQLQHDASKAQLQYQMDKDTQNDSQKASEEARKQFDAKNREGAAATAQSYGGSLTQAQPQLQALPQVPQAPDAEAQGSPDAAVAQQYGGDLQGHNQAVDQRQAVQGANQHAIDAAKTQWELRMPGMPAAMLDTGASDAIRKRHADEAMGVLSEMKPEGNPYRAQAIREFTGDVKGGARDIEKGALSEAIAKRTHELEADALSRDNSVRAAGAARAGHEDNSGFKALTYLNRDIQNFTRTHGIDKKQHDYNEISKTLQLLQSDNPTEHALGVEGLIRAARGGAVTAQSQAYLQGHVAGGAAALEGALAKLKSGDFGDENVQSLIQAAGGTRDALKQEIEPHRRAFVQKYMSDAYRPVKANVEGAYSSLFGPFGYTLNQENNAPGINAVGRPIKNSSHRPFGDTSGGPTESLDEVGDNLQQFLPQPQEQP